MIFSVEFTVKDDQQKIISHDKLDANDLIKLMAQLMMIIFRVQNSLHEEELKIQVDDDIPF